MTKTKRKKLGKAGFGKPEGGYMGYELHVNGKVDMETEVFSIVVEQEANRIPRAVINCREGDPANQNLPASGQFYPGDEVEISMISRDDSKKYEVFKGEVVKSRVCLRAGMPSLKIELRHPAFKMTMVRKKAVFENELDADVITRIFDQYGISAQIDSINQAKADLVQYNASDWDYVISRVEANGLLLYLGDGSCTIKQPDLKPSPDATLSYGADILDFDGEINASRQHPEIEAGSWQAKEPKWEAKGPIRAEGGSDYRLPETENLRLIHGGHRPAKELENWAKATAKRMELSRVRGRVKSFGLDLQPGDTLALEGMGPHFNADFLITGVRHELDRGTWCTSLQFGMHPGTFVEDHPDLHAAPAAGLIPAVQGLQIGVVDKLTGDPENGYRIGVLIGDVQQGKELLWARLMQGDAGKEHGIFMLPDTGDEVILGFLESDPRDAIIMGSLYGKKNPPPLKYSDENKVKGYYSEEKSRWVFDDESKSIEISTGDGSQVIELKANDKEITIKDSKNSITLSQSGIEIESKSNISIKTSTGDISLEAKNIKLKASLEVTVEGNAGATLKSSGNTTVKGGMVMIN